MIVLENQNYTSTMKDPFLAQLAQTGASFSNCPLIGPEPRFRDNHATSAAG
jgi:hypothetical protein